MNYVKPNVSHSVMFHHFHNDVHAKGQGSIDESQLDLMLDWLEKNYNLIGARDYSRKVMNGELQASDVCVSFDDALLCQYEIAAPVLKKRGLDAFYFIYSSPFKGEPDYLEIFRYFRNVRFKKINDFYEIFFEKIKEMDSSAYAVAHNKCMKLNYLASFPFYSEEDKWFRYLRDQLLGKARYEKVMLQLMEKDGFDITRASRNLWMNDKHLLELQKLGNVIGLHSYSHPTTMQKLSRKEQVGEFEMNYRHLADLLGAESIFSMSHPCGSYNDDTLSILREKGICIGFRSSLSQKEIRSSLEIPREDHTNLSKAVL